MFFFQAEDGIRDSSVTGVQTCALPISLFIFWESEFYYPCFGEILYSIQTGEPARTKLARMNGFEYLRQNPGQARIFADAMTARSQLAGPAIAAAYDFGAWGSPMGGRGRCRDPLSAHLSCPA